MRWQEETFRNERKTRVKAPLSYAYQPLQFCKLSYIFFHINASHSNRSFNFLSCIFWLIFLRMYVLNVLVFTASYIVFFFFFWHTSHSLCRIKKPGWKMGLQRDSTTSISQILYCKLWLKYSYSKSSLCHDKRISLGKIEEIKRKTRCEKKPLNLHKFSDKNTNHVGAPFKYFSTFYLLSVLSFPIFLLIWLQKGEAIW